MNNLAHNMKKFLLVCGNARSGTTILGSIIDTHEHAIVANETRLSQIFWRGCTKSEILEDVTKNTVSNFITGRQSSGYSYQISRDPREKQSVQVMGDKIWNPTTLLLHGDHSLVDSLEQRLEVPLVIFAAIRNPFNTIATMHLKSGATIRDRTHWYFMHCEALSALEARLPKNKFKSFYHEDLFLSLSDQLREIFGSLELNYSEKLREKIAEYIPDRPTNPMSNIAWSTRDVEEVLKQMERFPHLQRYAEYRPRSI